MPYDRVVYTAASGDFESIDRSLDYIGILRSYRAMTGSTMSDFPRAADVVIVGGGPCGLVLAIELGRRGISVILVDAKSSTARNPQANATQARTMEHFRRLGIAEEIRLLGLPPDYPTDIAYFTRYSSHELARFKLPPSQQARAIARQSKGSWSAAEMPHRVSQKFVEEVLRRHAESTPGVSLHYGWRLKEFKESATGVTALVESAETGHERRATSNYLIGADGARSTVRRQLGISLAGEAGIKRDFFGGRMVAVYLRAPRFYELTRHDRAWMYWAFNAERRSWLAAVNGRDEFAFHTQLKAGEDELQITERRARDLFLQVMGIPLDFELLAIDTWIAGHSLVAEELGGGRVYIGGDAAHLFTPAGGLGYNTAVEDAVNLGWKLAATIKGVGGPNLLASYGYERRKTAIRNTRYARQLADSIGNFVPAPALEVDGPRGDEARALAGDYLQAHARREFNIPGITFGGRYDGSPVVLSDGTSPPEDAANVYVPTATPGGRPPHFWLPDGESIYDLFGPDWTLLVLTPPGTSSANMALAAQRLGVNLKIVFIDSPESRDLYGAELTLIRPDQIVAWRGASEGLDADAVLAHLLGHETSPRAPPRLRTPSHS
jgi:2-polyprenyl-6-methoxyphenol hydroxylase-like FAD-dependent oxidoreductase